MMSRLPTLVSRMTVSSVRAFQIREFGQKVTGTVKWFNTTKGFGFIEPADKSGDCFVHQTQIKSDGFRSLAEGETVEFEIVISEEKGGKRFAQDVTGPGGGNVQGAPRTMGGEGGHSRGFGGREGSPPRGGGRGGGGGDRRSTY